MPLAFGVTGLPDPPYLPDRAAHPRRAVRLRIALYLSGGFTFEATDIAYPLLLNHDGYGAQADGVDAQARSPSRRRGGARRDWECLRVGREAQPPPATRQLLD